MKQLFLNKGKVIPKDVALPTVDDNSVLVSLSYSFISTGTESSTIKTSSQSLLKRFLSDVSLYSKKVSDSIKENGVKGTVSLIRGKSDQLMALGYSCSGQIIEVGKNVSRFKPGDYVSCSGANIANHAEFVSVPENLLAKISDKQFLKDASLTTIGAIAMQGVRRARLALGEVVCVIGLGLIGQITIQLLKLSGCTVIGVDLKDDRLKLAKRLGCDHVLSASEIGDVTFITKHYGVDATIITAAGPGEIINQAMSITRRKGKVVLVGDVSLSFNREEFYKKEIDFLISSSYGPGRYDDNYEMRGVDYPYAYVRWTENRNMQLFVDLIESGKLDLEPIISKEYPLDCAEDAYNNIQSTLGVVFTYLEHKDDVKTPVPSIAPSGKLRVCALGVGGFAKVKLLPTLKSLNVDITSIIDRDVTNVLNVAKQYGALHSGNDYKEAIDNVDMVLIATPHGLHARQAIDCLKAKKAVFLEKPAATTREDLNELKLHMDNGFLTVDFNRSFAPFNVEIKKYVSTRSTPLVINYRMNAGYIPKEHWIQSGEHGGRVIGEACHVFELFCYLTGSTPISVNVGALHPSSENLLSTDNFSAHITFADGSICSLVYTSIGSSSLSKERMEVFYDGKSIVMDDYKELKGYGLDLNKSTSKPEKGHEILLSKFISAVINKNTPPISYERIITATELSLIIDELAANGGGVYDFGHTTQ